MDYMNNNLKDKVLFINRRDTDMYTCNAYENLVSKIKILLDVSK